jgi:hypothetical protein
MPIAAALVPAGPSQGDDEHVRHAHAGRQRTDVVGAGLGGKSVAEQDAAEDERIQYFEHEASAFALCALRSMTKRP